MMKIKKLNKKGFTMVELLAVIVILGILAIISVAAVQGIIAKAKERYYKSKKYTSTRRTDSVQIKDAAGNTANCNVNVYVDKTAPSCGGVSGGSTSWKRGDRTVSVGCSDSDSGCGQGSYSRYFNWTLRTDNITIYDHAGNS